VVGLQIRPVSQSLPLVKCRAHGTHETDE
jgi:hypothetical protein